MALGAPQLNKITEMSVLANALLDMDGQITQIDSLFNGTPDWASLVTQEAIDDIPSFAAAGLTVQNVIDMIYILNLVKADLTNLVALSVMASLR